MGCIPRSPGANVVFQANLQVKFWGIFYLKVCSLSIKGGQQFRESTTPIRVPIMIRKAPTGRTSSERLQAAQLALSGYNALRVFSARPRKARDTDTLLARQRRQRIVHTQRLFNQRAHDRHISHGLYLARCVAIQAMRRVLESTSVPLACFQS